MGRMSERYKSFTVEDCLKWKTDKTKNPKTGRKIKENSFVYKQLEKNCNKKEVKIEDKKEETKEIKDKKKNIKSILEEKLNKEECIKWINNKFINPRTNNKLDKTGYIYGIIEKQCSEYNLETEKKEKKLENIDENIDEEIDDNIIIN